MAKALTKVSANIGFAKELLTNDFIDEIRSLLFKHYEEISYFKDVPLNPDFEVYRQIESLGRLRIFVARDMDRLIGYNTMIVQNHPHYKDSKQAVQDLLFLDPYYRGLGFGEEFIYWVDEELKDEGVQYIIRTVTNKVDYSQMLGYQDYKEIGREFLKCLM